MTALNYFFSYRLVKMSDSNENDYRIPRTLDAAPLFLIWDADSAIIFITCCVLGAIMGGAGLIVGILIGWIFTKAYQQLKEEGGKGLIIKMLFWFTPSSWATKRNPSHIREHIGN